MMDPSASLRAGFAPDEPMQALHPAHGSGED